jgi:hypothetical protein
MPSATAGFQAYRTDETPPVNPFADLVRALNDDHILWHFTPV